MVYIITDILLKVVLNTNKNVHHFLAWWPSWLEVAITGPKFGRGPSKNHSIKVWFQLAQWFLRRR
jgi:hypothetical protein